MSPARLLLVIAGTCLLLAALTVAFGIGLGPALAWGAGGFAAWAWSGAV